jgi:hypothetical protein
MQRAFYKACLQIIVIFVFAFHFRQELASDRSRKQDIGSWLGILYKRKRLLSLVGFSFYSSHTKHMQSGMHT